MFQRKLNYQEVHQNDFLKDMQDFFSGRKSGHIGTWRYSEPLHDNDPVRGMELWGDFVQSARNGSPYYIVNDELELIKDLAEDMPNILPDNLTIIDMGPGSKEAVLEKIGPFIETGNVGSYVAIDIVKECVNRTRDIFAKHFPEIKFFGISKDFYEGRLSLPASGTPVMVMFGQTLFNLPINPFDKSLSMKIVWQRLAKFRLALRDNGYLIIAQDIHQNGVDHYNAYAGEKAFAENLLLRIQRDLPVCDRFDPSLFSFEPEWVPETHALAHSFVCKEDMSFSLGYEHFRLMKGEKLYLHNTYKLTMDDFLASAQKCNFFPVHSKVNKTGRMAIHVLKAI